VQNRLQTLQVAQCPLSINILGSAPYIEFATGTASAASCPRGALSQPFGASRPPTEFNQVVDFHTTAGTPDTLDIVFGLGTDVRYDVEVAHASGTVTLYRFGAAGQNDDVLAKATPREGLYRPGDISRVVVTAVGNEILVNLNGEFVLRQPDAVVAPGTLAFFAYLPNPRTTVRFRNLLLATVGKDPRSLRQAPTQIPGRAPAQVPR